MSSSTDERACVGCGDSEEMAHLERCQICNRSFCADCAHRAFGRRFCSHECAHAYFFHGEPDDDENVAYDE